MKDNEIIKGLECCQPQYEKNCEECPYAKHKKHYISVINCSSLMRKDLLDLIKRQEAELEDLREIVFMDRSEAIKNLKAEARKEFVERLKGKFDISTCGYSAEEIVSDIENTIDNLLKEMEGK